MQKRSKKLNGSFHKDTSVCRWWLLRRAPTLPSTPLGCFSWSRTPAISEVGIGRYLHSRLILQLNRSKLKKTIMTPGNLQCLLVRSYLGNITARIKHGTKNDKQIALQRIRSFCNKFRNKDARYTLDIFSMQIEWLCYIVLVRDYGNTLWKIFFWNGKCIFYACMKLNDILMMGSVYSHSLDQRHGRLRTQLIRGQPRKLPRRRTFSDRTLSWEKSR
jgi:hypothetical protein